MINEELDLDNTSPDVENTTGGGEGDGLTPQEFAKKIKAKYPQYKDVDDVVLAKKMVEKFPQYKGKVSFTSSPKPTARPVLSKGVLAGQSMDSPSASASGGSFSGLPAPKQTFLQKAQEDRMAQPKVGQEQKIKPDAPQRVALEKKATKVEAKTAVVNEKIKTDVEQQYYGSTDLHHRFMDEATPTPEEHHVVAQQFGTFPDPTGEFTRYLKNKTDFFNEDHTYKPNETDNLRREYEADAAVKSYLLDSADFLKQKMKYAKTDQEKKQIQSQFDNLSASYSTFKSSLTNLNKKESEIKARNKEIHDKAASGEGNALYQTKSVAQNFAMGIYKPISDVLTTALDGIDGTLKAAGVKDGVGQMDNRARFSANMIDVDANDGFGQVYGSGRKVVYGDDVYIVSSDGNIVDKKTGSSINSFTDKATLQTINELAKSSKEDDSYFSGVALTRQAANTAGQLVLQVALSGAGAAGAEAKAISASAVRIRGGVINGAMMGTSAYSDTVRSLIGAGKSEKDAKAAGAAMGVYMTAVGTMTGMMSPNAETAGLVGQKIQKEVVEKALEAFEREGITGLKNVLKEAGKNLPKHAKEVFGEVVGENTQELIEGKTQAMGNQEVNEQLNTTALNGNFTQNDVINTMLVTSIATGATAGGGAVMKGAGGLFGMDVKEAFNAAAQMDTKDVNTVMDQLVADKKVTREKADEIAEKIQSYKQNRTKISPDVKGMKAIEATHLIKQRDDLKIEKKNLDEVYHPEINEKIAALNQKITETLKKDDGKESATATTETKKDNSGTETEGQQGETTDGQTVSYEERAKAVKDVYDKGAAEIYDESKKKMDALNDQLDEEEKAKRDELFDKPEELDAALKEIDKKYKEGSAQISKERSTKINDLHSKYWDAYDGANFTHEEKLKFNEESRAERHAFNDKTITPDQFDTKEEYDAAVENARIATDKSHDRSKAIIDKEEADRLRKEKPSLLKRAAGKVSTLFSKKPTAEPVSKSTSTNFDNEVSRVVSAPYEEETGHTFNLDGTTHDKGGLVIPVVSKNMKQSELTPQKIQEFVDEHSDKIDGESVKVGIYKFPNSDEVSIDLNIVADKSKREEALAFAKEAGQESLFDLDTFENVKTGADGKNPKTFTAQEFKEIAKRFSPNQETSTEVKPTVSKDTEKHLTDDGEGNFVFYHYSPEKFDNLDPNKSGSNKRKITSGNETGAWSSAGGVNFLYTANDEREGVVNGDHGYEFKIPKDEVYDLSHDVNGYKDKVLEKYKSENDGKVPDNNTLAALMTKEAAKDGFKVTLSNWDGKVRAQTNQALKPSDTMEMKGNTSVKDFNNKYDSNRKKDIRDNDRYDFKSFNELSDYLQAKFYGNGKMDNIVGMRPEAVTDNIMKADIPDVYKKLAMDLLKNDGLMGQYNSIPAATKERLENVKIPNESDQETSTDQTADTEKETGGKQEGENSGAEQILPNFDEKTDLSDDKNLNDLIDGIDKLLGEDDNESDNEPAQFSKGNPEKNKVAVEKTMRPLIDQLVKTKLAGDVRLMTSAEMDAYAADPENKLKDYNKDDVNKGFVHRGVVFINTDHVTPDTLVHEFGHLWINAAKKRNPALYKQGLEIIKTSGQKYIDIAQSTQPNLSGKALLEEALAQAIGDNGAKLIEENGKPEGKNWIQKFWDFIAKAMGVHKLTGDQLSAMTADQFATAIAIDLLDGKPVRIINSVHDKSFTMLEDVKDNYPLSYVGKKDLIDLPSLIHDIIATGKKISFWAADQLGIGEYTDSNGVVHHLDAGLSFALDPKNRKRGVVWASGAERKTIEGLSKADYVFMTSGSPIQSKMFNQVVFNAFKSNVEKAGMDYNSFKEAAIANGAPDVTIKLLDKYNSFEDLAKTADRKEVLKDLHKKTQGKTKFAEFLKSNNIVPDFDGMRDGFLKAHGFDTNDVVLVLKINGTGDKSTHSTYEHEVTGEVVGVPNAKVNANYLLPKDLDEARLGVPLAGAGGIKNDVEIDNKANFSKGQGKVEVATRNALAELKAVAKDTRNASKALDAATAKFKESAWYRGASDAEKANFDQKGLMAFVNEQQAKAAADNIVSSQTVKPKPQTTGSTINHNTGVKDTSKKIVSSEAKLLQDKFKNLQRGFQTGVKDTNQLKKDFIDQVKDSIKGLGKHITEAEIKTILNQVGNVTATNIEKVSATVDNIVTRLENRAEKAKLGVLKKLQKQAGVKARTVYGNAGGDIPNLIKLPPNQIPAPVFDEYYATMEKLAKGQPVDADQISDLYAKIKADVEALVERKNESKKNPKPKDATQEAIARANAEKDFKDAHDAVTVRNSKKSPRLTDFERGVMKRFLDIPKAYFNGLSTSKLNEIAKALNYTAQSGNMSNKVLSDVVMKYNAEQATKSVIQKVGDVMLRPARGLMGLIDKARGKEVMSDDFAKAISKNLLHHIDMVVKGINGTTFYTHIVHPITSNFNKAGAETNKVGHAVSTLLDKAGKSSGSGFKTNIKIQFFVRQREFESNPELRGTKVYDLDDHMQALEKNKNNLNYTKKDLALIQGEYDKVKGKSAQEMYDGLTKEEKALVDFMDKHLSKQEEANRDYNNHLLGGTLTYPKDYFPKKNSFVEGNQDEDEEVKARLFGTVGATSVKGDASNERVALGANPLDFNTVATFMTSVKNSHLEQNLAFPIKQTLMTITNLKKSDNESLVKLANALEKSVKNLIDFQMKKNPYSYTSTGEKIFKQFTKNSFTRMLIDPVRLFYDVAANYSTVYGAYLDKMPAIIHASKVINEDVNTKIHENIASTQAERLGGSRSSDYKSAQSTPITEAKNRKAEPSFGEQLTDLYSHNKLSDFSEEKADQYYKYADLPAQHLWKFNLMADYKANTGKEFDGQRYLNDKDYREEIQDDLQKAAVSADKKTAYYFNSGATSEQKLSVQGGKHNMLSRANNFLRTFTFNENRVFWDSLHGMTGFGNTTFDSKKEALRAFTVINARGILYGYLGQVVSQWVVSLATGANGDDEKKKEWINKQAMKRSLAQNAVLVVAGNSGAVTNLVANFIGEMINQEVVKASGKKYDAFTDSIFYAPNAKSSYTDFLNNLGAEGLAVKAVIDYGVMMKKLADKARYNHKITTEDLVRAKTLRNTVSLLSQATGLPIDRLGKISQKVLDKKYPYKPKTSGGGFGKFNSGFGGSGFGSFGK